MRRKVLDGIVLAAVFTLGSIAGPALWQMRPGAAQTGAPVNPAGPAAGALDTTPVTDVVKARKFQLVDEAGKVRIEFAVNPTGVAQAHLFDGQGKTRLSLEVASDGSASIAAWDGKVARTAMGYTDKSGPFTMFYDAQQRMTYGLPPAPGQATSAAQQNQPQGNQPGAGPGAQQQQPYFTEEPRFQQFRTGAAAQMIGFWRQQPGTSPNFLRGLSDALSGQNRAMIEQRSQMNPDYARGVQEVYSAYQRYQAGAPVVQR